MKYIDEGKIQQLLKDAAAAPSGRINGILAKARSLKRLALDETAALLAAEDPKTIARIFETAAYVKETIYGKRVVLFAPLYISNLCVNGCLYCSFRAGNTAEKRRKLSQEEIAAQVQWLLERGHKRILMVIGEMSSSDENVDYYIESIKTIYSVSAGKNRIKRVNVNCAPLSVEQFRKLKAAGIGTYQVFQETYHEETYRRVHPVGPKSDPDNRIDSVDRAFQAGIDDIGVGPLYGLYDWRFETLALLMHIEHMEQRFGVGPHTISVPRIEPAVGTDFVVDLPHRVPDEAFKKLVAALRLSVPYTGIILSTRETSAMRDELIHYGVSQISAESRVSPGGYSSKDNNANSDIQFCLGDQRTLNEIMGSLIEKRMIPSFCAACYRQGRTGETFMNLAKPGTIKGKCSVNALVTLKEYLDDFATPEVQRKGYRLIEQEQQALDEKSRAQLKVFFDEIEKGLRDRYV